MEDQETTRHAAPRDWTLGDRPGWNERKHGEGTLGYAVAAQAPNGIIHLITSMNHPSQHFEMNEASILSGRTTQSQPDHSDLRAMSGELRYPGGKLHAKWSGSANSTRGYLLDGPETWFYPNGGKQYEVEWKAGRRSGTETLWFPDGNPRGVTENCVGRATVWSSGREVSGAFEFENGELKHSK